VSSDQDRFIYRYFPPREPGLPILLLLHGTGGDEHDLLPLGQVLLPEAGLLSPRGRVLENGMPRFFRRLSEGVFDLEDLERRTQELADFVLEAAQEHDFSPDSVIAAGYSNGANIAASVLLLRPEVLSGAVLFHAQVPLEPPTQPDLAGKPVYIGAGRVDPLIPAEQTQRLADILRAAGADVTLHWEMTGHSLSHGEVEAASTWLRERAGFRG
jgi:predicted esterase